jgi:hypothetical protein
MARQVSCLDSAVPPGRNQNQGGNQENRSDSPSGKSPTRPGFAFIGGKILSQAQPSLRHSTSALHFLTLLRAAFYYFLPVGVARIPGWPRHRPAQAEEQASAFSGARLMLESEMSGKRYFEA